MKQHGGASVTLLEISGNKGVVQVNGKTVDQNVFLSGGDQVVFSSSGEHTYVSFCSLCTDHLL